MVGIAAIGENHLVFRAHWNDFDFGIVQFPLVCLFPESYNSSRNYPGQIRFGDLRWLTEWRRFSSLLKNTLSWTGSVEFFFGTSSLSRFVGKQVGMQVTVTTKYNPKKWLEVRHGISLTKNINKFTTTTLDWSNFEQPRVTRPGGAENVAEGFTATGEGVISFAIANEFVAEATLPHKFAVLVGMEIVNGFTYDNGQMDTFSSAYAVGGRGQRDLIYGSVEVYWAPINELEFAVGSVVMQAPKSADNVGFRFPWWDTTNGAMNRQTFYLRLMYQR